MVKYCVLVIVIIIFVVVNFVIIMAFCGHIITLSGTARISVSQSAPAYRYAIRTWESRHANLSSFTL